MDRSRYVRRQFPNSYAIRFTWHYSADQEQWRTFVVAPSPGERSKYTLRLDFHPGRLRGHRLEAARLALSLRALARLAQDEEPGSAGGEARGGRGLGEGRIAVKIRTNFTFRIDTWTADGESVVEHVAGVEDYEVALATYRAACERWPGAPITLRQGARVIEDSRRTRTAAWSDKGSREGGR